jgi:hypothetical protein
MNSDVGASGGNFNSVVVGTGTATAHVNDTITNAAVNISVSTVFEHVAEHHEAEKQLRIPPDLVASVDQTV